PYNLNRSLEVYDFSNTYLAITNFLNTNSMGKTALITGASSGIGRATARVFAENGLNLIICGRRKERLEELQKELSAKVDVHCLSFDIRDKTAVFKAYESLPRPFSKIEILINNAGNARSEEHTSELQSRENLVCRLL